MSEGASQKKTHVVESQGRPVVTRCGRPAASVRVVLYPEYPTCGSCDRSIRSSARRAAVAVLGEDRADAIFQRRKP